MLRNCFLLISCLGILSACSKDSNTDEKKAEEMVLTTLELEFLEEFEYVAYKLDPDSSGAPLSERWQMELNIFLDGDFSQDYLNEVTNELKEINKLFGNGVSCKLVTTLEDSNVHLIYGSSQVIENKWVDMYNLIRDRSFSGYALYNFDADYHIFTGRIWISTPNMSLFRHELGHILGFGHSSAENCGRESRSFMCSGLSENFITFDRAIVKTLYRPEIKVGKTFQELKPIIEKLLLTDIIKP
jgi:hypothetical protein